MKRRTGRLLGAADGAAAMCRWCRLREQDGLSHLLELGLSHSLEGQVEPSSLRFCQDDIQISSPICSQQSTNLEMGSKGVNRDNGVNYA